MSETEAECRFCGGCEAGSDVVACPACMARDKNETIAARDAEIERLRADVEGVAAYFEVSYGQSMGASGHTIARKIRAALALEQKANDNG